jgi:PTS system nitrogen regulatory IIA component
VLEEMVDRAREISDQHIDRAQALQVLGEREQLAPTGYGHGIALPHCRLMGLERAVLVFGRHPAGVVFGGVDEEPCDLVMLILSSARKPSEHLQLLAATAHILGDEEIRRRLRAAPDAEGMLAVLDEVARAASAPPEAPRQNEAGTGG